MRNRARIKSFTTQHLKIYIIFFGIFFAGLCAGAAVANIVSPETCNAMVKPFQAGGADNNVQVLGNSFLSFIKPVIFMWLMGFTGISIYCILISLSYKGAILGFVIGAFLRSYGLSNGLLASLAGVLPQNLIYIPVLFICAVFAYQYSLVRKGNSLKAKINYFGKLLICAGGCLAAALVDAYITSFFIGLSSRTL